jgi:hypothetical protein
MWRLRLLVNLERWVCLAHNHTHHIQRWRRLRCVIRILRAAVVEICSVKACGCRQFMGEPNNMCALCGVRRVSLGLRATTTTLMLLVATCVASNHTLGPFGWNYKPAEKHCWLIFCERKILFRLKK